mgnify:CR=1 FL=1|tara:strand:+ start:1834 stop:2556 length:723 start_codon:yes stop_codon:yes gene_type:complete
MASGVQWSVSAGNGTLWHQFEDSENSAIEQNWKKGVCIFDTDERSYMLQSMLTYHIPTDTWQILTRTTSTDVKRWLFAVAYGDYQQMDRHLSEMLTMARKNGLPWIQYFVYANNGVMRHVDLSEMHQTTSNTQVTRPICPQPIEDDDDDSDDDLDDKNCPDAFKCPITMKKMKCPVIAADGYTYERNAIEGWLAGHKMHSPMKNKKIHDCALIFNHNLKILMDEYDTGAMTLHKLKASDS